MSAVEIEDAILKHPDGARSRGHRRAGCLARAGREGLRRRRSRRATRRSSREIQDLVRQRLSQHEYPRLIEFVTELPKTPAGKVNRKVLREREQGASTRAASMDRTKETSMLTRDRTQVPEDHRARPGRAAPAHRRQDRRDRRAVVPRGDARQHPPLCARHRRRQSAVVRARICREDQVRRHHRAAELPLRHQPHHLRLCRRPARRACHVVGRRLELAQDRPPQRRRSRPRPG